jgi:hypothetical protein
MAREGTVGTLGTFGTEMPADRVYELPMSRFEVVVKLKGNLQIVPTSSAVSRDLSRDRN